MADFTAREKAIEARREVGQRKWVYPKMVAAGKMKQDHADRAIKIMEAIKADYEALAEAEEAKGRLI